MNPEKRAILLVNVGTPDSPEPQAVGRYLKEFLMDPWVIDIPWLARWILVHWLVVPRRQFDSAKLYQNIWNENGSPLLSHSRNLREALQEFFPGPVFLGMRYGTPSLEAAVEEIARASIESLTVVPLYPQYSLAATESSIRRVQKLLRAGGLGNVEVNFVEPFYNQVPYLDAVVEISRPYLDTFKPDQVVFSFHGLPERQVKKTDPSGRHCAQVPGCCDVLLPANKDCYRAQSFWTAKWVAKRLGLRGEPIVGFQSRLGRTPWIKPYSDVLYAELAAKGVKRLAVISPSFTADCLETLEEIGIRAKEQFRKAGGEDLLLVPSLNAEPQWVQALAKIVGGSVAQ